MALDERAQQGFVVGLAWDVGLLLRRNHRHQLPLVRLRFFPTAGKRIGACQDGLGVERTEMPLADAITIIAGVRENFAFDDRDHIVVERHLDHRILVDEMHINRGISFGERGTVPGAR